MDWFSVTPKGTPAILGVFMSTWACKVHPKRGGFNHQQKVTLHCLVSPVRTSSALCWWTTWANTWPTGTPPENCPQRYGGDCRKGVYIYIYICVFAQIMVPYGWCPAGFPSNHKQTRVHRFENPPRKRGPVESFQRVAAFGLPYS